MRHAEGATRRAPRLGPDQLIAGHITRTGRFRRIDPSTPRALPRLSQWLGTVAWLVFMEEMLRRGRRASRAAAD
jgi:hypothetical protein